MAATRDATQVARCPNCGEENDQRSRFCSSCGTPLNAAETRGEERKLVSVLFVDLVGFTSRSDRADPEDVRDALRLYHAEAKQRIEQHGGTLEKFIGDAVMAVFGAPVAHGDDAERAVRAGLAVLEGIEELNREHGLDLAARAAVDTGEAMVAVGTDRTGEALAIGDVVNTASRLQSAAPAGRLLVGEETHRATRHAMRYDGLDPVEAKGKVEAVPAWLAVEPVVAPAERRMTTNPLVGRDRELELIRSLWTRTVAERRPHLLTVLGPPGIGKSRLCSEVSALVEADGGRILRGRCLPYGAQTGYQAFSHLVRGASGILESDSATVARQKLQGVVDELLPSAEAVDTSRYLALLLGLGLDDAVEEPRLLFFAARRFVECAGIAGGGGTEALALAALGCHEQAIEIWDELFVIARELGRGHAVLLNYSSLAYRELHELDEARRRSEEALELTARQSFGMPSAFARSDLVFTDLLADDVGRAQAIWPALWESAAHATGWTTWLIYGRLAAARAEIALRAETPESAIEWASQAIDIARRTRRRKYESRSLVLLGEALARLGRRDEALQALRAGVEIADALVGPPARWNARAALGRASYAFGDDNAAFAAYHEAAGIARTFASTLNPDRATRLLRVPAIAEILSLAGHTPGDG